jgi:hypothetical protein
LETIPNFETLFERKQPEQVQALLDAYLDGDNTTEQVEKFGDSKSVSATTTGTGTDAVEAAFNDLLNG